MSVSWKGERWSDGQETGKSLFIAKEVTSVKTNG